MLFMGQEWAASSPFLFFTDHAGELGRQISVGRQNEFSKVGINANLRPDQVPDPQAIDTFLKSKLPWSELAQGEHAKTLTLFRACLGQRKTWLRGAATERTAWTVEAIGEALVVHYFPPHQPQRLVLTLLRGDGPFSLQRLERFRLPDGLQWRVMITSAAPGESVRSTPTEINGPVTLLLEATASREERGRHG